MSIPRIAVKHPVTATMVFVALFVLGIISLTRIGLELFPDINLPGVAVFTISPGVGPEEMESSVTIPIERSASSLNGIESVDSTSEEGLSIVRLNFASGTVVRDLMPEIRERVNDAQNSFPDGTERPILFSYSAANLPSLELNVFAGSGDVAIRELAEREIIPEIERVPGVAEADLFGGRESALLVELRLDDLNRLGVPIAQVLQAFQGENINLPGGTMQLDSEYLTLRAVGKFSRPEDVANVIVGSRGGVPVFVRDVADVTLGLRPQEEFVRARGREGLRIQVRKQSDYNTVEVNDGVLQRLDALQASLPPSVRIEVQSNQADSIRMSIGGVASAAWQGGLLAVIILLFFLRNVRSTVIVATAIPLSVIATFTLIDFGGMTLNITSLLGITLAIGMFVDNAIVVLESIYRKQLAGMHPHEAAVEGAEEVSKAITASTLTTMAVFLPMLFVEGLAGILFSDLSLTIAFSLFLSLVSALAFIPVLSSRFLSLRGITVGTLRDDQELSLADVHVRTNNRLLKNVTEWIQRSLQRLDEGYERLVGWSIEHAKVVIASSVVLLGLSIASVALLGMEFLPEADEGQFALSVETRVGAPYEYTAGKVAQIEEIIRDVAGPHIVTMASRVGDGGSNRAGVAVKLTEKNERTDDIWSIVNEVDERIRRNVVDVQHNITIQGMASMAASTSGGSTPIVIDLAGSDLDEIADVADEIAAVLSEVEGVRNVRTSFQRGRPELQLVIRREEAAGLGITAREIATTIRAAYSGVTVSTFSAEEEDYDIVVGLQDADRNDREQMQSLFFINQQGSRIPLENVVDIREDTGPVQIERRGRTRNVQVLAGLTGERALNRIVDELERRLDGEVAVPLDVELTFSGSSSEMDSSFRSMFLAMLLAVALVYMVMASQFESFLDPFLVMFSVPFAVVGLVGALLITNTTFNILAFVGGILLVGIVVNNAIVLIDYMNTLRRRGVSTRKAIMQGGKTRLKPVLMTSLTTIFGLMPMALGLGSGSEFYAPIGRAVVGGLTTSTLVTLVLIPTVYWIVQEKLMPRLKKVGAKISGQDGATDATGSEGEEEQYA